MPRPETGSAVHVFIDGREYRFGGGDEIVTVGRDPQATIPLTSDLVSRQHVQLRHGPAGWELEDLGSANGTYVGGQRVNRLRITTAVDVWLGPPSRGVAMRIQPAPAGPRRRPRPTPHPGPGPGPRPGPRPGKSPAAAQLSTTLKLLLLIGGLATTGVGVFFLDWVTYEVTGAIAVSPQGAGLDFDAGKVSLIAGGISGLIGIMGLQEALSRQVVGLVLVVGAAVTAVATVYFMSGVTSGAEDQIIEVPGISVRVDASLAAGGPVTLVGAGVLAVAGLFFVFEPAPRKPLPPGRR